MVRNVYLEPATAPDFDWVSTALLKTKAAFMLNKPAIVSIHRGNFISGNDPENRERGLKSLEKYFTQVVKHWPNVLFMSSGELTLLLQHQ